MPLTYSVEALRMSMEGARAASAYSMDLLILALYTLAFLSIATSVLKRKIE
jgi:ABC-type multidrug transport system permease subunit